MVVENQIELLGRCDMMHHVLFTPTRISNMDKDNLCLSLSHTHQFSISFIFHEIPSRLSNDQ